MREMFSRTGTRGSIKKKKTYKLGETAASANHAIGKPQKSIGLISRNILGSPQLHLILYNLGDLILLCRVAVHSAQHY
jgi:hypothetical protein